MERRKVQTVAFYKIDRLTRSVVMDFSSGSSSGGLAERGQRVRLKIWAEPTRETCIRLLLAEGVTVSAEV
ncbi:hypothetical protein [Sphingomonas ginsengisoli (ex An et al. 2013)]|uniref:hypothetical protein n=1 Tax=Sphingomonas ginsengisoli (ex An et al. 2013) TaxID=363835 RepID=UPI003CCD1E53